MAAAEFDYIVVGGGAAGCVMAARLAAGCDARVALVERGARDTNRWIHIPGTFFKALQGQDADAVTSDPDPTLNGLPFTVPQGRVLGGGSSVNGMIYMRGQARDYDDWEQEHGCSGWSYTDVLPIFRRQERNTQFDNAFHGTQGKLIVSGPSAPHPISARAIEAAIAAGLPATDDFNGARQEGAGWYQVTAHRGKRQSAARCFLHPELGRETLTLFTGLIAARLRFTGRRATGLEAVDDSGGRVTLTAQREIILTAGSFQSPKILMLSGIGPQDALARLGIDVVHDAPEVGANYQDHVGTPVTRRLKHGLGLFGQDRGIAAIKNGIAYFGLGRGLLTSNLLDAGACADTTGDGRPDVQFNMAPFAPGAPGTPPLNCHAMQVHPMTMRPKSRGRLEVQSTDPAAPPRFLANVLDHPDDLDTLRRGVRLARGIFAQAPLKEVIEDEIWPGADVSSAIGSNTLDDAIRKQARTIYHPAGTCRMGPSPSAVVDLQGRVYGVEGVRVADCSIMPALVSGNTNAPTMMIADKIADAVLADY